MARQIVAICFLLVTFCQVEADIFITSEDDTIRISHENSFEDVVLVIETTGIAFMDSSYYNLDNSEEQLFIMNKRIIKETERRRRSYMWFYIGLVCIIVIGFISYLYFQED